MDKIMYIKNNRKKMKMDKIIYNYNKNYNNRFKIKN